MQARNVGFTDDDLDQGAIGKAPRCGSLVRFPHGWIWLTCQKQTP